MMVPVTVNNIFNIKLKSTYVSINNDNGLIKLPPTDIRKLNLELSTQRLVSVH